MSAACHFNWLQSGFKETKLCSITHTKASFPVHFFWAMEYTPKTSESCLTNTAIGQGWGQGADESLEMDHCKSNPFVGKAIPCAHSDGVLSSQEKNMINSRT